MGVLVRSGEKMMRGLNEEEFMLKTVNGKFLTKNFRRKFFKSRKSLN